MSRLFKVFLVFAFVLSIGAVKAENTSAEKILVFSTAQNHPMTLLGQNILTEAYKQLGYQVEFKFYPLARSLVIANSGEVDGEVGRIRTVGAAYKNLREVPVMLTSLKVSFVKLAANPSAYKTLTDARQARIGLIRGSKNTENLFDGGKVVSTQNATQLLRLLEYKRIDLAVADKALIEQALANIQNELFDIETVQALSYPIYHFLHVKNQTLIPELSQVLAQMRKNGQIEQLEADFYNCIRQNRLQKPETEFSNYSCREPVNK